MVLILLEALGALALLLLIVWWTMFSGRRNGELPPPQSAETGHAPASPAPKRKRVASNETWLKAPAVAMVNVDHHTTMRVRTDRDPCRSAHHAVGISKRE